MNLKTILSNFKKRLKKLVGGFGLKKRAPEKNNGVLLVYKEEGETMGQLVDRIVGELSIIEPVTFAGRLDPLACGWCVLLVGDERFKKEEYTGRAKTYRVTFLEGVRTDTKDPLGVVMETADASSRGISRSMIKKILQGSHVLRYPDYSSKTVDGIPLWQRARSGSLLNENPTKEMMVHRVVYKKSRQVSADDVCVSWKERIKKIEGDFRQEEILASYARIKPGSVWRRITVTLRVSSGTYVRALTELLECHTHTPWIAEHIERIHVDNLC